VNGVVTAPFQFLCQDRRQRIVHQKLHGSVSGSSRSRTAEAA
jgi:hypothetical protein